MSSYMSSTEQIVWYAYVTANAEQSHGNLLSQRIDSCVLVWDIVLFYDDKDIFEQNVE